MASLPHTCSPDGLCSLPPPTFSPPPPHASRVCPVAVHPSSPLTTRTSARILRLRGEARSFASAGEPTKVCTCTGPLLCSLGGFQPTATHMSLRGELPRRRACTSVADTEGAQLPSRLSVWYRARAWDEPPLPPSSPHHAPFLFSFFAKSSPRAEPRRLPSTRPSQVVYPSPYPSLSPHPAAPISPSYQRLSKIPGAMYALYLQT